MRADQWIDCIQTAALITGMTAVVWAFNMLRRQLGKSMEDLRALLRSQSETLRSQTEMEERMERIWKRIDDIEIRGGLRGDVDELSRLKRFMDALEEAAKPPPRKK